MRFTRLLVLAPLILAACSSAAATPRVPSVSAHSVTAGWTPNMNVHNERRTVTHGTAAQATALLRDIATAPKVADPDAPYSCPADFGIAVRLDFGAETSAVSLSGCEWVRTPGYRTVWVTAKLVRDLRTVAPPTYRQDLRGA